MNAEDIKDIQQCERGLKKEKPKSEYAYSGTDKDKMKMKFGDGAKLYKQLHGDVKPGSEERIWNLIQRDYEN